VPVKQVFFHYERKNRSTAGFKYCPFCRTGMVLESSEHKLRPTCPNCGFVQYRNPAPTVSILIVDGDQVLLGKRGEDPGEGTWALPSGYVEYEDDFIEMYAKGFEGLPIDSDYAKLTGGVRV
jgi:8-oxo-dGTP diphosphatase